MAFGDSVKRILRDEDLDKVCDLFGFTNLDFLKELNSLRLLNAEYIRQLLIRADYERLTSGVHVLEHLDKKYKFPEVRRALQNTYHISAQALREALHGRNESMFFCTKCGDRISRATQKRTGGLCSNCFADSLDFNLKI